MANLNAFQIAFHRNALELRKKEVICGHELMKTLLIELPHCVYELLMFLWQKIIGNYFTIEIYSYPNTSNYTENQEENDFHISIITNCWTCLISRT